MAAPIVKPDIPYNGEIPEGLFSGKLIRIQGVTHPDDDRFNINLQIGPNNKPRDDTALHLSVRLNQGYIARNTYKDGAWGDEQGNGSLPIGHAQSFEILILTDPHHYKIAVNGQHFCEFPHRIPFQNVSHLLIDGDVSITLISFEGIVQDGVQSSQATQVNAVGPQGVPPMQYGPPQGNYGPPQGNYGPPPNYGGYGPPPPPGAQPQSELGGFFEKAQEMLAGAIASGAAEKLVGSILSSRGGQPNQQAGYAPQNARYGIYPDLPTQDLIAQSGGTITSGPQGSQHFPQNTSGGQAQNKSGPVEDLLATLLGGAGQGQRIEGAPQSQSSQDGAGLLSGFLNNLLSGDHQNQQSAGQVQGQQQTERGSDALSGLLSSLLSGNQQTGAQSQAPQQKEGGSDALSGILSNLLSGNKDQPAQTGGHPTGGENQPHGSDVLSGILSSLFQPSDISKGPASQSQINAQNTHQTQNEGGGATITNLLQGFLSSNNQESPKPPGQNPSNPQAPSQTDQDKVALLTNLLQGLLAKAREQPNPQEPQGPSQNLHNRPQTAPGQEQAQDQQQYGQYPHSTQQEQRGPVESLLSGLLSGGGQQSHQTPHMPGGDASVGGLGSMGGILSSLAGSFLNKPDQNQRHNF